MAKLIGAAAVISDFEGRVLLVKHSYGKNNWDLSCGKAEDNESAEKSSLIHYFLLTFILTRINAYRRPLVPCVYRCGIRMILT
ncbi:MAG: NUDIX domain-containing protein [Gorillibacterium sp.]|nr:NUDIX domain-containing protein [Gorillibacterium sp.]